MNSWPRPRLLVALAALVLVLVAGTLSCSLAGTPASELTATASISKTQLPPPTQSHEPPEADTDKDGLPDIEEAELGTDPNNLDTDADGLDDGEELEWGTDPLDPDTDGDTIPDGREVYQIGTNPLNPDSDGDGIPDNVDPDPGMFPTLTPDATPSPPIEGTNTPPPPTMTIPSPTPPATPTPAGTNFSPTLQPTSEPPRLVTFEKRLVEVEQPERILKGKSEYIRLSLVLATDETPEPGTPLPGTNTPIPTPTRTPEPGYEREIFAAVSVADLYDTHNIFAIAQLESVGLALDNVKEVPLSPGEPAVFTWTLPEDAEPGQYRVALLLKLRYEPKDGSLPEEKFLWEDVLTLNVTTLLGLTGPTAQWVGGLGSVLGSVLAFPLVEELAGNILKIWIKHRKKEEDEEDEPSGAALRPEPRIEGEKKIKILFLAANPKDTTQLRIDEEIRTIDQALRGAEFRDRFDIEQQWAVRVSDLQDHFLRFKPDIVHFSGHGSTREIILEDLSGEIAAVSTQALSDLFRILKDNIQCVVLNACYSENQAQAIAGHIDCVVGMSQEIGDEAAISFAAAFYRALGYGRDVKTAFELGTSQIDLSGLGEQDIPRLLAQRMDPGNIVFIQNG